MIFSLLFSLKNNEENKRKREGKSWGNFIELVVVSCSPLDGIVGVHITFLEHGVDLLLQTINNLPQALNHLPRHRWNCRNPTTAFPIHTAHTTTATTTTSSTHAFSLFFLSTPNSHIFPLFLFLVALLILSR